MAATGSISGTIRRDSNNSPVDNACVFAQPDGGAWSECVRTETDGTYTLSGLAAGSYRVWAGYVPFENLIGEYYVNTPFFDDAQLVPVATGAVAGINLSLALGGQISGKLVRDVEQTPIPGMCAYAYSDTASNYSCTDPSGNYTIPALPGGTYRVRFEGPNLVTEYYDNVFDWEAATTVNVFVGGDTAGIDAGLMAGATVSGRVTQDGNGTGIAGVDVYTISDSTFGGSVTTGADGTYSITGIAPGQYRVKANSDTYVDEYYHDVRDYEDATVLDLSSGEVVTDLDMSLALGGTISGSVTRDLNGVTVDEACVVAVPVTVPDAFTNDLACWFTDGAYSITGVAPGQYVVEVHPFNELRSEYYDDVVDREDATPVTVVAGAVTGGIDFGLAEDPPPQLRVTTTPALPADIIVDGIARDTWGLNWAKFDPGSHEVCFGQVPGYAAPPCQTVNLTGGQTTTIQGAYSAQGYLRVVTSPAAPSTISVDGVPRNDWGLWAQVAPGTYNVCFGAVAGSNTPACRNVVVAAGQTATTTGTFVGNASAPGPTGTFGYLRATTSPAIGAMVSVDGSWRNSWGLDWVKLATGSHTVCFGDWPNLTAPASCQTVDIANGATTTVSGSYAAQGFLRVQTSPATHANIIVNGDVANAFGMWTAKAPGTYSVCFGPADGFNAPSCQPAVVTAGNTTTITGTYAP